MPKPLATPPDLPPPARPSLSARPPRPPRPPLAKRLLGFLSGFGLATALLLILGLLTWFATLEQIEGGLHATLAKYFDWRAWVVIPKINGETIPIPLPGGYWTCVLLFVNLALGGVLRMRKGVRQIGVLIAHAGILFLLVAGAVSHHRSERGHMMIPEGGASNVAEDYYEHTVEVTEIRDGKPAAIHVVRGHYLSDLTKGRVRVVRLPELPFDMEFGGYLSNADVKAAAFEKPAGDSLVLNGYYLSAKPGELNAEADTPACVARVIRRNGARDDPFLLASAAFHPFTVREADRVFTVALRKRQWVMPFTVRLDKFTAEFHPGTMKPASFESAITRIEGGTEVPAVIRMNEPLRYAGRTFYQASYQQLGQPPHGRMASVFEVVSNPADQWPLYSLCVVTAGLLLHFIQRLTDAIRSLSRPRTDV